MIDVKRNTPAKQLAETLQNRGHRVRLVVMNSGIIAIVRQPHGALMGGGDGRRKITWRGPVAWEAAPKRISSLTPGAATAGV